VGGRLPFLGAGLSLLRDPTGFFLRARVRHGDTFGVDAFGYRLFCVFSAEGVQALYRVPEKEASFGLATFELVLRHKIPLELAMGRRTRPHDLFGSEDVQGYLGALDDAVSAQLAELSNEGEFECFAWARRLGHRLGLACWAGAEAASAQHLDRLIPPFDVLDTSESFVRPHRLFLARATGKRRELRAMHRIETVIAEILSQRGAAPRGDFLDRIVSAFSELPEDEQAVQVARDVMLLHMGAQSNLYAALAWTLVNLLLRPALLERVAAGDESLLDQCANESIRMAQRSITLRRVLKPIDVFDGVRSYRLEPGTFLTTLLSVNNTRAAPGLERFDPAHYQGRRLAPDVPLAAREPVSTFGHGAHSCPAQRFSITAIRIAVQRLLADFELEPRFREASPRKGQLGAVARAAAPCRVRYVRRSEGGAGS
jgi:cytochrome P450